MREFVNATTDSRMATEKAPTNDERRFWEAVGLANHGRLKEAKKIMSRVFEKNGDWRRVLRDLPSRRLLNVSEEDLRELLS